MKISYQPGGLLISIPAADPAAAHAALMQGITNSLQYGMESAERSGEQFAEAGIAMLQLLRLMLPDEQALAKAYAE